MRAELASVLLMVAGILCLTFALAHWVPSRIDGPLLGGLVGYICARERYWWQSRRRLREAARLQGTRDALPYWSGRR